MFRLFNLDILEKPYGKEVDLEFMFDNMIYDNTRLKTPIELGYLSIKNKKKGQNYGKNTHI